MAKRRSRRRTLADAKAHFAECIREVEGGRSIVLTRHGRPVATLEPIHEAHGREAEPPSPQEVAEPESAYGAALPPPVPSVAARRAALHRRLVEQVWPHIPAELLGRGVTKREQEEILGYTSPAISPPRRKGA